MDIAFGSVGLIQKSANYRTALKSDQSFHSNEIENSKSRHEKSLLIARQTFLIASYTDVEQYCQELNENLISSWNDAERDMVDQRNQQFQTLFLAATLILTAAIALLIQGTLKFTGSKSQCANNGDDATSNDDQAKSFVSSLNLLNPCGVVVVYSVSTSLSVLTLSISVFLCVEMIFRVTNYMFRRSRNHSKFLKDAIENTRQMKRKIEALPIEVDDFHLPNAEELWRKHEDQVHTYLFDREKINSDIGEAMKAKSKTSFSIFWRAAVKDSGSYALGFFYAGAAFTQIAHMAYMWDVYVYTYQSVAGASIAIAIIGFFMLICIVLGIYFRKFDSSLLALKSDLTEEEKEESIQLTNSYKERISVWKYFKKLR